MTAVMLVDDHPVVLRGLCDLIQSHSDLVVVAQHSEPHNVIDVARGASPDVMVLDLFMDGADGFDIIVDVVRECPDTRVVVLSVHTEIAYVHQAFQRGARAYVSKVASGEELVRAVREAAAGRTYLSPDFSWDAIEDYARRAESCPLDYLSMLTSRERQVLELAADGQSSTRIAEMLNISPRTVEKHRANLYRKLDLASQTDLVRFALQQGIVSLD